MNNTSIKLSILAIVLAIIAGSCIHDDFEKPESKNIPKGNAITISELRQIYIDSVQSGIYPEGYKFTDDLSVYCVCTMDDKSGNIYKSAYVQDNNDAINLHLMSSGGLYVGDSVRLYLKGLILNDYENMLQLDSVHVDDNIVKIATDKEPQPEVVDISQIQTGNYQAKLVKLEGVQFIKEDVGKTFADAKNLVSKDRTIEDCNENTLLVRTSGYADFASHRVPEGKGYMTAIVGQFRDDWQLLLRKHHETEIKMDGLRCGVYDTVISQNFNSLTEDQEISIDGWTNINSKGSLKWTAGPSTKKGMSAVITGSDITGAETESWLITPSVSMSEPSEMVFSTTGTNDANGELKVLISENYNSGDDPLPATWTEINVNIVDPPPGGFADDWVQSGTVDLSTYTGDIHVAFKYEGTDTETTTYYLDDFVIYRK